MKKETSEKKTYFYERRLDPCQVAQCCAEHARFTDECGPCNDGRNAFINGRRDYDPKMKREHGEEPEI